jgi:5-methylcytosine-specific restriction endonuclease McrBC regulatory subunit McrC
MPDIYETFIYHIVAKQDRLRRVLRKWTPAARGQDIENAVRRAALNVLQLYPDLTDEV